MWRFAELLEIDPPSSVSLGEGDTALIDATSSRLTRPGGPTVCFKAEYQNPTGSFKDRIAAMATAIIARDELIGAVGTSSGNGGASIAAEMIRLNTPGCTSADVRALAYEYRCRPMFPYERDAQYG